MATTTGPDLSNAVAVIGSLMDDTCEVYLSGNESEWTLGPDNRLIPVAAPQVYAGPCKLRAGGNVANQQMQAGQAITDDRYTVDIPINVPPLKAGSIFILTSSRRMPMAVGTSLVLGDLEVKTFAVQNRYAATSHSVASDA